MYTRTYKPWAEAEKKKTTEKEEEEKEKTPNLQSLRKLQWNKRIFIKVILPLCNSTLKRPFIFLACFMVFGIPFLIQGTEIK